MGARGFNLVFGHGFEFQDAARRVAPRFPKTLYVTTSGNTAGENLAGMSFSFADASYLAGMLAAAMSKGATDQHETDGCKSCGKDCEHGHAGRASRRMSVDDLGQLGGATADGVHDGGHALDRTIGLWIPRVSCATA